MTFPAILHATASVWSGAAALSVAVILARKGKSLFLVSLAACAWYSCWNCSCKQNPLISQNSYSDNPPLALARLSMTDCMTGTMNIATIPPA